MPRPKKATPSYLLHAASGRGRAVWTDLPGIRRERLHPGLHNSPESLTAFAQFQLEIAASPTAGVAVDSSRISVAETLLAYLRFAETYYVDAAGKTTAEFECMKAAIRPVRDLYAAQPAWQFGPVALRAVRQRMIDAGLCRAQVNHRIDCVKRVFRWAALSERQRS
jgi:hypothetical protein